MKKIKNKINHKNSSGIQIYDCFCGIGPWQTRDKLLPYKPEDILQLMNHFGITKALIHSNFAINNGNIETGNQHIIDAYKNNRDRFAPAFVIKPNPYNPKAIEEYILKMQKYSVKALWLGIKPQLLWIWAYKDILIECCKRKIPIFINREDTHPEHIYKLCKSFPKARIVLVGISYQEDWWLYPLLKEFKQVRVSTGHFYIPTYNPMTFIKHFSANRLLFGSGLPFFSPGGMISHITYANIAEKDKQLILYKNLEQLLEEAEI